MRTFNESETALITAMRDAVIEKGADYIYSRVPNPDLGAVSQETCLYIYKDEPSCIVGHGILNANLMSAEDLSIYEGSSAFVPLAVLDVSSDIQEVSDEIQSKQDMQEPWGEAFTFGLDILDGRGYDVGPFRLP